MNKNIPGRVYGAVALLAVAPHLYAQQAPRCSDLYDDAQRLACYDAAFGKPARPSAAAAATSRAPAAPAVAPAAAPVVRASPASAPAAVAPAAPVAPPAPRAAAERPKSVSAGITGVTRRADGRFVATLDNGQVWSQLERDPAAEVAAGDNVTVRRGMLGSYILITTRGVQTKVKSGK
jgi:hypothetical protein